MGRKKIILFLISLFLIVLVLVIAVLLYGNFTKEQKYGNTEGNIVNRLSHIIDDGNSSYIALNTGIYKGEENSSLEKISEGRYAYLNYIDGWLYALEFEKNQIVKMKPEGTSEIVLYQATGLCSGPWVINDKIYFKDIDRESYFRMKTDGSGLKEVEPKWGSYSHWIYAPIRNREYEYSLSDECDLWESQHTDEALYAIGWDWTGSGPEHNGKLYRYEYGSEEGEVLEEGVFRYNIAGDKIYYLISGEEKSELCVMRMDLNGSGKEEITRIKLEASVNAAGVGVGQEILCLSIALEPDLNHVLFLIDIETGEYIQVMEDDTFVSPE